MAIHCVAMPGVVDKHPRPWSSHDHRKHKIQGSPNPDMFLLL